MTSGVLFTALLLATASAGENGPQRLSPWIVRESPLRPEVRPGRGSASSPLAVRSDRALGTLADVLRDCPGVIGQESFGGFDPPRLSLRGSGLQSAPSSRGVALLFNRLPLALADGSFNSALLDPTLIDEVAVRRGLEGWRAAAGAAGGALDFSARALPTSTKLRMETGSFGTERASGGVQIAGEKARGHARLSFARQDGFRAHSAQQRTAAFATIERPMPEHTIVRFEVYHADARYEVPGPLTWTVARSAPRTASPDVLRDRPRRDSDLTRIASSVASSGAVWELEIDGAFAWTADDFYQLRANGVSRSRSADASAQAAFTRRFEAAARPHQFRIAASGARGRRELRRYANDSGEAGALFADDRLAPAIGIIQIEETIALTPRLMATLGLATIAARREIRERSSSGAESWLQVSSHARLPGASLRWQRDRDHAVFASVSAASEPPTFDDLQVVSGLPHALVRRSRGLAAQRAVTWEMGGRGRRGGLAWEAAAYRSAWENELLRLADAQGAARGTINASPTIHEGIELSASWRMVEEPVRVALSTTAGWTRFRFKNDEVYGRDRLAGVPPHFGQAELVAELPRGGFFAAGADWTAGRTRADHAGQLAYGGQARVHLRAGWRYTPYWTCFAEVKNLLGRRTIASTAGVLDLARTPATTSIFLPASGRALSLGIEWRR